jgi:uncharacterized protein YsxB (DUF464 family)
MVEVELYEDSRGRLSSFVAQGHAGWAEHGSDVVCAAVSTLLQAAWLGLVEVAGVEAEGSRSAGRLTLAWPADACEREDVRAIVGTAALSVERLAAQFPDHVRTVRLNEGGTRVSSIRKTPS